MKRFHKTAWMMIFSFFASFTAAAMPIKSQILRSRAYFQEADQNLLEALDLKSKSLYLGNTEIDQCGQNLVRRAQTLTFSCTMPIPTTARFSKLRRIVSAKSKEVAFGGTKRTVLVGVSEDARQLTLSTAFDATGIDFDLSKFNDDFYAVYAKVAQLIIADAVKGAPVQIEVLESR